MVGGGCVKKWRRVGGEVARDVMSLRAGAAKCCWGRAGWSCGGGGRVLSSSDTYHHK